MSFAACETKSTMYGPIGACRRKPTPFSRCARTPYQMMRSASVRLRCNSRARTRLLSVNVHRGGFGASLMAQDSLQEPPPYPPPQAGEGERQCLWQERCSRDGCSRAQPSGQGRQVERAEAVMRQPAHVGLEEGAQVVHAVFEHGDAIDAEAPGKTLVLGRIEPAVPQHVRMHHAAAEDLQPVLAFTEANLALVAPALDVDLERGLGEREERRAEAHLHVVHLEEGLAEFLQDPFEVAEMRALVDHEALDLMEHGRVGLVGVAAIGAARADHADQIGRASW